MSFVLVFRVPERQLFRADSPARGGGDTRWLAQNCTGRMIHTATEQDQLLIGFRQGLGRFLEARLVSPIGFPDGGTTSISDWIGQRFVRFGAGRASAPGLWRMAVGTAVLRSPGGLPHPCFIVMY